VHLAHRARQEGSIRAAARTTGRAIALSGLTTLIGFGSLILGNHWGVRSLGLLLVIGITSSLVAALVVLPGLVRPRKDPRAGSADKPA
jgi:predicted RND superfamily exporter protein